MNEFKAWKREKLEKISGFGKSPIRLTSGYGSLGLSLRPVHAPYKVYKNVLENYCCDWAE